MTEKVRIERDGKYRILAKIPWYGGLGSQMAKQVSGARPNYEKRPGSRDRFLGWSYPLDLQVCREMRQVFGEDLRVGPQLAAWAREEIQRERELDRLRAGGEVTLRSVPQVFPKLWTAMCQRPYQAAGAAYLAYGRRAILGDDPGLGKTLQALAALAEAEVSRVLVLCKKSAMTSVWAREAARWLEGYANIWIADGTTEHKKKVHADHDFRSWGTFRGAGINMLICNIEQVRGRMLCQEGLPKAKCVKECEHEKGAKYKFVPDFPYLFEHEWDAVIADESHRALVGESHLSKNITQTRLGMVKLPVAARGLKIALSATPYRGKLINGWGTLNWLRPDVFTSKWRYVERYWEVSSDGYKGAREIGDMRPDRIAEFDEMISPYVLRRTKGEVAADLPPKLYAGTPLDPSDESSPLGIWLPMLPEQERAYTQMAKTSMAELQGADLWGDGHLTATGRLAVLMRLKQFATSAGQLNGGVFKPAPPSNKLEWILDHLEECECKHVIASQFAEVIEMFFSELSRHYSCAKITGKISETTRLANMDWFQDGDLQIMLLNTKAGGESITLDAADHLIIVDESEIPDDQEQLEGRVHRLSRPDHQVIIYYLRSLGTIEEEVACVTAFREQETKGNLDGSRGVGWARLQLEAWLENQEE